MRVTCDVEAVDLDGDYGGTVPGVRARCRRCGHAVRSYGNHDGSRKRCLVLMRKECPRGEQNFYVDADG